MKRALEHRPSNNEEGNLICFGERLNLKARSTEPHLSVNLESI